MIPLRIDFTLGGMMAVPQRTPYLLDAILMSAASEGEMLPLPFARTALPIKAISTGKAADQFIWLASAVEVEYVGPCQTRHIYRNPRPLQTFEDAHQVNATRVDLSRGITRTIPSLTQQRQAVRATAYCIGDPDQLETLLKRITHLGAMRHQGLGLITSLSLDTDEGAKDRAWMRPVPAIGIKGDPYKKERVALPGRCTPPYWNRQVSTAFWPSEMLELD